MLGDELAERVKKRSLDIYSRGGAHADQCGNYCGETPNRTAPSMKKICFSIDECRAPDSSCFWRRDQYSVGQSPPVRKQFVRDYPKTLEWTNFPRPRLPKEVGGKKFGQNPVEAFRRLTGSELVDTFRSDLIDPAVMLSGALQRNAKHEARLFQASLVVLFGQ